MLGRARGEGLRCEGVISVAFGCPYEGHVPPERVFEIAGRLKAAGAQEIGFGDTTGMANPAQVRDFFPAARDLELPFKATAGLHHPVRSQHEHGYLNFLTAADRAAAGADEAELRHVLGTTDPAELGTGSAAGRRLFVSIGSCSFAEPVEDLQRLGVL